MICRMCLLDSTEVLEIFSEENSECNIPTTIARHFWFEPKSDDPISSLICNTCWWKIESFHTYYLSVEEAHRKLSERFSVKPNRHSDAGIKVYFKVERTAAEDANDDNGVGESEVTLIEVGGHQSGDNEIPYYDEDGFLKEEEAVEELNAMQDEEKKDQDKEQHQTEEQTVEVIEEYNLEEAESETEVNISPSSRAIERRSKYLEAQKNLQEFIKIETVVDKPLTKDDPNEESDSDNEPLIVVLNKHKRYKTDNDQQEIISLTGSKPKPKSIKSTTNDYLKRSREDDLKIAQHMKLKCDICGDEYQTFAEVKGHYREAHNTKGYVVCCNKRLYKRVLILDHVNRHLNPEHFKCEECNKTFADKQCLKNHMIRHQSDETKMFPCDQCPKRFVKQYMLDQHRVIHTPEEEREHFCEHCGKAFSTKNLLQTHRRYVHEKIYGQMCHICARVIRGKEQFAKHQLEHAGVTYPKEQCKICGAFLKNKHSLRKHLLRHEEANSDHVCKICGKVAPSKGALRSHINYVHSSDRTFKCTVCDKAFKKAIVLKEHMTTHTGEVLYTCPHCPKTFNSHANMHAHRKKVHRKEWEEGRKSRYGPSENLTTSKSDATTTGNEMCGSDVNNLHVVFYESVDS